MSDVQENSISYNNDSVNLRKTLHNICNWNRLDNIAIEYHKTQEIVYISYQELLTTKNLISNYLKSIEHFEFIGINVDIPEYCVVSLMLGILSNNHGFVNVPLSTTEYINLKNSLHIQYLFSKQVTAEGSVIHRFMVHNEYIYFIKLKHVQKECMQNIEKNDYAYAICSSGSTGTPKVIRVPHSCIVPNILDLSQVLSIRECDKIAQFTNFTFDPSIVEIFLALSNAGTLFMTSKSLKNDLNRLITEAYFSKVTILQITPSVFLHSWTAGCLKTTILSSDTSLRAILFGGEPFPKAELIQEIKHPHNHTKIYNIYGITEVSCWASINEIEITNIQCNTQCLGKLLSHTIFQVRNENGGILTKGTGFLYIGSNERVCVVNEENFEDLELPVFRDSGDIVHIDEEANILYKGRRNSIVKRFGNKVDLIKLETFMLQVHSIKSCYALWDENYYKLHLYLIFKEKITNYSDTNNNIMGYIQKLDSLYKPDKIHFLDYVDLTSNGKISIEFLKECSLQEKTIDSTQCSINTQKAEEIFNSCWKNNLKYENGGFVKLGGTSITALHVSSTISQELNMEFPELIGMLLRNASYNECIKYITTILKCHENKVNDKCTSYFNSSKTIPLTKSVNKTNSKLQYFSTDHQSSDLLNQVDHSFICQWYKCRGQTYKNVPLINQIYNLQYDTISKIEILKTYDLYKCVDASPVLFQYTNGKKYATVGSHSGFIVTIDLENQTDSSAFKIKLPDRIEASVLVLDNFKGVVGCYDGNVYCLHLKTGEIIWKYKTGDIVKCTATFSKKQGVIFIGSYDSYVYCLSAKDGTEVWKTKGSSGSITASGCLHSLSNSVLFGTLDGFCLALKQSSGEITWKHKLMDPIFVAPVTLSSGLVLFCSVTGILSCFDIKVNVKMWEYKINGNVFSYIVKQNDSPLADCENIIIASQNKNVYCLQSKDLNFQTEPVLKDVLTFHSPIFATLWYENNFLFVACTDGTLNIYNFTTNRLIKSEKLPGEVFSSPVVDNDIAIIGCRDNNVYVLKLI